MRVVILRVFASDLFNKVQGSIIIVSANRLFNARPRVCVTRNSENEVQENCQDGNANYDQPLNAFAQSVQLRQNLLGSVFSPPLHSDRSSRIEICGKLRAFRLENAYCLLRLIFCDDQSN